MIWKLISLSVILTSVLGAPPLRSNVKKDYLMCEVCHVITRDMQLLLEKNATQARVEGYLSEICNRLTANQDSCLTFVKKNIQSVFAKLSDGLDPQQVCILLKVCPSSETEEVKVLPPPISNIILQGTSKEEPESNPIECDICKFIVDYLDKKIVNNRSEAAINATLTELCNKLPGQLGDVCKKLEPQLLKILEDEFLPAKVCKEVKACSAEAALPSRNLALGCQTCKDVLEGFLGEAGVQMCSEMAGVCGKIKSHRNNHNNMKHFVEPEQIQMPTGQAECTLCKFVVNEVDNLIQNNQTKDNINASLQKICNSLPGELQGLCETFAPELLTAIENGLDPNMACTKIKLCQGEMELDYDVVEEREEKKFDQYDLIEKVMKDADREEKESLKAYPLCVVCQIFAGIIDTQLEMNKTVEEISDIVFMLCGKLDIPLQAVCKTFAPIIINGVIAGFEPTETCEKIGLCPNSSKELVPQKIEKEHEKAESGPGCAVCKLIVSEVDSLIGQNKSAAEINSTVFNFCNKLPAPLNTLCITYAPMIVKDVLAGFDPEKTCEKIRLCTNGSLSLEEFVPTNFKEQVKKDVKDDSIGCTLCKFIVQEIDTYIGQNQSAAQINASVYNLCSKLPAPLNSLCKTYAPMIVKDVLAGFDPEMTCEKVKLCTNSSLSLEELFPADLKEEVKDIKDSPGCTICKFIVQEIDNYIGQNQSAAQINASVYSLCNKLPGPIGDLCKTYAPMIIKDVLAGFDPEMTCEKVRLCTNSSLSLEELFPADLKEEVKDIKDSPGCTICKFIVQELDNYIGQNQSAAQINASVYSLCNKLPGPIGDLCKTYAPMIIKDVLAGFDPEMTCEKVRLCTNDSLLYSDELKPRYFEALEEKDKDNSIGCTLCKFIVQEIDTYIGQNQSAAQINASVYNLCSKLPAPLNSLCITYAPMIVKDVLAGFDPEMTCEKVKLCTNDSLLYSDEFRPRHFDELKENSKESVGCTLCKFIVQEIDTYIGQNQSAAQINASVYNLCNKLPAPLSSLCKTYAPMIVKDVLAGFDPEMTCEKVKLCTKDSLLYSDELKPSYFEELEEKDKANSIGCTLCKFIVQEIDTYIGQNQSAVQINASAYNLCSKLPAPLNSLCKTYAPMIVKDVLAGFDPEMTCEKVKLCTNDSFVEPFMKEVKKVEKVVKDKVNVDPVCGLCEFVVQLMDQYLAENKTIGAINASIMGICNLLPTNLKAPCILFAPQVVNIVAGGVAPEDACKAVHLCTDSGKFFHKELTGLSCGKCHGIVEIFLPKKYSPEFGDVMCKSACPVARRRRYASNVKQDWVKFEKEEKLGQTWRCDLCEFIIKAVNTYLETNSTEQSLEDYMNDICNLMPEPFKDTCLKSVPDIIRELSHGVDQDILCQTYMPDECKNDTKPLENEVMNVIEGAAKDNQCDMCKDIIKYIDEGLNHDKGEVKMYVDDVCERLPSPTSKECKTFAAKELEEILIKIIDKLLTPEEVCHMIRVC